MEPSHVDWLVLVADFIFLSAFRPYLELTVPIHKEIFWQHRALPKSKQQNLRPQKPTGGLSRKGEDTKRVSQQIRLWAFESGNQAETKSSSIRVFLNIPFNITRFALKKETTWKNTKINWNTSFLLQPKPHSWRTWEPLCQRLSQPPARSDGLRLAFGQLWADSWTEHKVSSTAGKGRAMGLGMPWVTKRTPTFLCHSFGSYSFFPLPHLVFGVPVFDPQPDLKKC